MSTPKWAVEAARANRIRIHSLTDGDGSTGKLNKSNSQWLDSVCVEDAAIIAAHSPVEQLVEALTEINQHLRDVVETHKNGDTNNWNGYYLPEFAKLSAKYTELLEQVAK